MSNIASPWKYLIVIDDGTSEVKGQFITLEKPMYKGQYISLCMGGGEYATNRINHTSGDGSILHCEVIGSDG